MLPIVTYQYESDLISSIKINLYWSVTILLQFHFQSCIVSHSNYVSILVIICHRTPRLYSSLCCWICFSILQNNDHILVPSFSIAHLFP